jgi:cobalt-zinc-cadmium efflux system protein
VLAGWVLVVGAIGLAVNLLAALVLFRGRGHSLNVEGALRHVLADLVASAGVIVAAVIILATGWEIVDPIVSVLIALLILLSSWGILRDATQVLLEATPRGIDADQIARSIASSEGVVSVHDLHVWTITSGFPALSAHVLVGTGEDCHARRRELERVLRRDFDIEHTTLQVDHVRDELLTLNSAPPRAEQAPR